MKFHNVFTALLFFLLVGTSSVFAAGDSPESLVACGNNSGEFIVIANSTPEPGVDMLQCEQTASCGTCVKSLENQGCKIIDLKISQPGVTGDESVAVFATYSLSCKAP